MLENDLKAVKWNVHLQLPICDSPHSIKVRMGHAINNIKKVLKS